MNTIEQDKTRMSLKEQLVSDIQDAMRSGDELRKSTLRMARAAIKNAELARSALVLEMVDLNDPSARGGVYDQVREHRKLAQEYEDEGKIDLAQNERAEVTSILARHSELDDEGLQDLLRKEIKQRRQSADEYKRGNRQDLVEKELAEVAILEAYLPQQMSEADIETEARALLAELGNPGPKDMSKVMPAAMSRFKGRADGRTVNQVIVRLLAEGAS